MGRQLIAIVLTLSFSLSSTAACTRPVSYLQDKAPAPCAGYLFSPEKELEVRLKIVELNTLKEVNVKQEELIKVLNGRVEENVEYNAYLAKRLRQEKRDSFWEKTLYFALGALVTGIIATNVGR